MSPLRKRTICSNCAWSDRPRQRFHRDAAVSRDGARGETFLSFSTSNESRVAIMKTIIEPVPVGCARLNRSWLHMVFDAPDTTAQRKTPRLHNRRGRQDQRRYALLAERYVINLQRACRRSFGRSRFGSRGRLAVMTRSRRLSPSFDTAFAEKLRETVYDASAAARDAADELDDVTLAITAASAASQSLMPRLKSAITAYDNLSTRTQRLRDLLDQIEG